MFRVRQKVVCIDAHEPKHIRGLPFTLTKGAIYTIAKTGIIHPHDPEKLPCVDLIEIPHKGAGYWAHRFRPIVERKTDISIFTEMLNPSPANQREAMGEMLTAAE